MGKIYMFDNNTGIDMPEKIDTRKVEVLLGSVISDIHKLIENNSSMFCVFTHIKEYDIVVPTIKELTRLKEILNFGGYNFRICNSPNSIWYTNKVKKNIIISDTIDLNKEKLSTLLAMYLNLIDNNGKSIPKSSELDKTPDYQAAINICDTSPCTVIIKRSTNEIIYKSKYGRVSIPYTQKNTGAKFTNKIGINISIS